MTKFLMKDLVFQELAKLMDEVCPAFCVLLAALCLFFSFLSSPSRAGRTRRTSGTGSSASNIAKLPIPMENVACFP
jgi:hypothetical protein